MFAYCGNNPVSMADDGGQWAHLVIGALVGGAINVASSYITYKTVGMEYSKESLAVDFVSGAASGALAASRVDLVGSVVANAVIGGASYMIGQSIKEEDVTLKGFSTAVIAGTVSGFVGGKGANGASIKSKLSVCKQVLKSSTSPKKTSMYSNKLNDVFGEIVINAARAMLASHSSNLINNNIS